MAVEVNSLAAVGEVNLQMDQTLVAAVKVNSWEGQMMVGVENLKLGEAHWMKKMVVAVRLVDQIV